MRDIKNKTLAMCYIELKRERRLEDLLHELYIEKGMSIREVAKDLGVHYHTVNKWLKEMDIEVRLPHAKLLDLVEIKQKLKENENGK